MLIVVANFSLSFFWGDLFGHSTECFTFDVATMWIEGQFSVQYTFFTVEPCLRIWKFMKGNQIILLLLELIAARCHLFGVLVVWVPNSYYVNSHQGMHGLVEDGSFEILLLTCFYIIFLSQDKLSFVEKLSLST